MKEDLYFHGIKALIRNTEWRYLLLKVNTAWWKNPPKEWYRDIPGGRAECWLTIEENLHREMIEETGIDDVVIWRCLWTSLSNIRIPVWELDYGLFLSVYECSISENTQVIVSSEHTEFNWFSREEVKKLLWVKYNADFLDSLDV